MKRGSVFLTLAAVMYVVAWFLPVIDEGTTLNRGGLPGWEALITSLAPIWVPDWAEFPGSLLSVLSGLTNVWFIFAISTLTLRTRVGGGFVFWGSVVAALVNSHWIAWIDSGGWAPEKLRIGFCLWFGSFLLLTGAARRKDPVRMTCLPPSA